MNAPAKHWRPGDEPPRGWRRDPEDSRALRTMRGELVPGEERLVEFYHQRPFYWEGISAAEKHEETAERSVEAKAARVAGSSDWCSLATWFVCHESGTPALNWKGHVHGGIAHVGERMAVLLLNTGNVKCSFAIVLQGIEQVS